MVEQSAAFTTNSQSKRKNKPDGNKKDTDNNKTETKPILLMTQTITTPNQTKIQIKNGNKIKEQNTENNDVHHMEHKNIKYMTILQIENQDTT